MTRISFGTYRSGVREPSFRVIPGGARQTPPTPTPIQQATIARHHRDSPDEAREYMVSRFRGSDYWGSLGTPQNQGRANMTIRSYDNYVSLTRNDDRPVITTGLKRDLEISPNVLGVRTDVVLLDPRGYVPRLVLWDTNELTEGRAVLYAAPVLLATEAELGEGRVAEIEIIHLRSPRQLIISAADARAAADDMAAVVARVLSEP